MIYDIHFSTASSFSIQHSILIIFILIFQYFKQINIIFTLFYKLPILKMSGLSVPPEPKEKIKVVFMGDRSVGKSSIIRRFVYQQFLNQSEATIGVDYLTKNIRYQRKKHQIEIWDTAGQEKYRALAKGYLRNADACVFVYDCSDINSYLNLPHWIQLLESSSSKTMIKIIAGNKIDLGQDKTNSEQIKQKVKGMHEQLRGVAQYLVSAKENTNIDEMFKQIISNYEIRRENKQKRECIGHSKINGYGISCCRQ